MQITSKYYNENTPIQKHLVDEWISNKTSEPMSPGMHQQEIEARIGYIVSCIWKPFSVYMNEWVYENADFVEKYIYDDSDPNNIIYGEDYYPDGFFSGGDMIFYNTSRFYLHSVQEIKKPNSIKYNGKYSESIPIHWLYSEFQEELDNEVTSWYDANPKQLEKLNKIQSDEAQKRQMKIELKKKQEQILTKLSEEEQSLIRFK